MVSLWGTLETLFLRSRLLMARLAHTKSRLFRRRQLSRHSNPLRIAASSGATRRQAATSVKIDPTASPSWAARANATRADPSDVGRPRARRWPSTGSTRSRRLDGAPGGAGGVAGEVGAALGAPPTTRRKPPPGSSRAVVAGWRCVSGCAADFAVSCSLAGVAHTDRVVQGGGVASEAGSTVPSASGEPPGIEGLPGPPSVFLGGCSAQGGGC